MESMDSSVPPGFRFHPTEEELVGYYLTKKVASQKIDLDVIKDIDLYRIEPWEIQERCRIGYEEQSEWYFFSHKDRKYPTGTRTNRATLAGFWKATGRDKAVHHKNKLIGMRKTLVFYKGRAPNGKKTDWIVHEYRLETEENAPPKEEGWVVCRAFKKRASYPNRPIAVDLGDSNSGLDDQPNDKRANVTRDTFQCLHDEPNITLLCKQEITDLESLIASQLPPLDSANAGESTVTDWRALDKLVATQLSPDDGSSGAVCHANSAHGDVCDPQMAMSLLLRSAREQVEAVGEMSRFLSSECTGCNMGVCLHT